jgi:hypothetical protein
MLAAASTGFFFQGPCQCNGSGKTGARDGAQAILMSPVAFPQAWAPTVSPVNATSPRVVATPANVSPLSGSG